MRTHALNLCGRLGLSVAALWLAACSAEADFATLASDPRCQPQGPKRTYALQSFVLPPAAESAQDLDGDGHPENASGDMLALAGSAFELPGSNSLAALDLINAELANGRGLLLMEVQAPETGEGCVGVDIRPASPRPSAEGPLRWALGYPTARLRGWGNHQRLQTVRTARLRGDEASIVDLFLPTEVAAVHGRLFGAQLDLATQDKGRAEARLHGVWRSRDLADTAFPPWARQITETVRWLANPDTGRLVDPLRKRVGSIEEVGRNKAKWPKPEHESCYEDARACRILPEELELYFAEQNAPDLAMFDAAGNFQPQPSAQPGSRDSYSFGMGLRLVEVATQPGCPSGTFCTQKVPLTEDERILAAWAGRSSDLWLLTDRCRALHFDGLAWTSHRMPDCGTCGQSTVEGRLWGARNNRVWAYLSPGGWRRWDGGDWRLYGAVDCTAQVPKAIHGVDEFNIWALAATEARNGSPRRLMQHASAGPGPWMDYSSVSLNLQTLLAIEPNLAYAGGYQGSLIKIVQPRPQPVTDSAVLTQNILGLVGRSASDVWAVTGGTDASVGSCLHFDGRTWHKPQDVQCDAPGRGYLSAYMDGRGVIWAGGEAGLLRVYDRRRSSAWLDVPHDADRSERIDTITGATDEQAVWAIAGQRVLLRYQP